MSDIYQFTITLAYIDPPIWRRVLVPSSYTLNQLHQVIQLSFAWHDYHLFMFVISGQHYDTGDPKSLETTLQQLDLHENTTFDYVYDFRDNWECHITLEKCLPKACDQRYPYCITGKRAAPPEDCGGIGGYAHHLEVLADSQHPDYQEMDEWKEEAFDPEAFDKHVTNKRLGHWS